MSKQNVFAKNFLVNIKQGNTAQYLFLNFTKRQIMEHIVKHGLFGEALESIVIVELTPSENGVVFLGALKDFESDSMESSDDA